MKVFCRALLSKPSTGKGFFAHRLAPHLVKLGVELVSNSSTSHDIDLAVSPTKHGPEGGKKYILRLDGVYWGSRNDKRNAPIAKHLEQSDGVVFQSKFCKKSVLAQLPRASKGVYSTIIRNGADPAFYIAIEPMPKKHRYQLIASARWRRNKRLKEAVKTVIRAPIDIGLWVLGDKPDYKVEHPRIEYLGRVPQEELGRYYKGADAMLHLGAYDPCPNAVVECIAAGTPVVCVNSGGTPELVGADNGVVSDADTPFNLKPVDVNKTRPMDRAVVIRDMVELLESNRGSDSSSVSIEKCALSYFKFMKKVCRR